MMLLKSHSTGPVQQEDHEETEKEVLEGTEGKSWSMFLKRCSDHVVPLSKGL